MTHTLQHHIKITPNILLTVAMLFGVSLSAKAQPVGDTTAEITVILASEESGAIEESLKKESALQKPPFNAFKSMRVLSQQKVTLNGSTPAELMLPNGRKLQLALQEIAPNGRLKMRLAMAKSEQDEFKQLVQYAAAKGEPFFVAGQKHQGGTLLIGIRVGSPASK